MRKLPFLMVEHLVFVLGLFMESCLILFMIFTSAQCKLCESFRDLVVSYFWLLYVWVRSLNLCSFLTCEKFVIRFVKYLWWVSFYSVCCSSITRPDLFLEL